MRTPGAAWIDVDKVPKTNYCYLMRSDKTCKPFRLPLKLTHAMAVYYANRRKQGGVKWNKDEDWNNMCAALPKGWGMEGRAGTFWVKKLSRKNKQGQRRVLVVEIDESNWPKGIGLVRPAA